GPMVGKVVMTIFTSMNNRAFSILELIIVLVIIAVLLSLAAPSLRGFYSAQLTSNAAAQVVTLARFAQQRAMTEARPYRLHLDVQTQTYWLTAQDGGLFI